MSDPVQQPRFEYYNLLAPLVGGLLSIIGGFAAVFIRARLEKKQEIEYIKISLRDELNEMCTIIGHLKETFKRTQVLSNDYLNELDKGTEAFAHHKQRLFLIRSEDLRRQIVEFYKKLDENIRESLNKVGTLGTDTVEQEKIVAKFTDIATQASNLEGALKKYNYRLFWLV